MNTETPLQFLCTVFPLCFHFIQLFPRWRSPVCCGAVLSQSPDAELNGAPENAFVTLNPCSVSVDDIIVWEHITSPLPRLSLLKTAPPYVYWTIYTHAHMQTHRPDLFTNVISTSTCILITEISISCGAAQSGQHPQTQVIQQMYWKATSCQLNVANKWLHIIGMLFTWHWVRWYILNLKFFARHSVFAANVGIYDRTITGILVNNTVANNKILDTLYSFYQF